MTKGQRVTGRRAEYRVIQEEVEKKLDEGYSKRMVYDQLAAAGRLTMSYSSFCDYARGRGERLHRDEAGCAEPEPALCDGQTDERINYPIVPMNLSASPGEGWMLAMVWIKPMEVE